MTTRAPAPLKASAARLSNVPMTAQQLLTHIQATIHTYLQDWLANYNNRYARSLTLDITALTECANTALWQGQQYAQKTAHIGGLDAVILAASLVVRLSKVLNVVIPGLPTAQAETMLRDDLAAILFSILEAQHVFEHYSELARQSIGHVFAQPNLHIDHVLPIAYVAVVQLDLMHWTPT